MYVGKAFTASIVGRRIESVTCEKCAAQFHYELIREGTGKASAPYFLFQASGPNRANAAAQKDLAKRLACESELVPCPRCQWVNGDLIDRYRRSKYRRGARFAAGIAVAGPVAAGLEAYIYNIRVPSARMQMVLAVCALSGAGVLLIRRWLRHQIDPNRNFPGMPVIPPGTPPALVERHDSQSRQSRLEPVARRPEEPTRESEWAVFQADEVEFPWICCVCLANATTRYNSPFKVSEYSDIGVPLCGSCSARLRKRWWVVALIGASLALALAALLAATVPGPDAFGRWGLFCLLGLFASTTVVAAVPNRVCRPYRFGVVDAGRRVVKFSAQNPAYTELIVKQLREANAITAR